MSFLMGMCANKGLLVDRNQKNYEIFPKDHNTIMGVSSWCNGYSDGRRNRSTRVRTPVALLRSLSGKYPGETYESAYPPSYGLNSNTTVILGEWLWH